MTRLLPFEVFDGKTNMSIDERILSESIEHNSAPTLRFYGWSKPTLTLGRNQSLKGINLEFCETNDIDIIRRLTGGRAVLHQHELTYSFVTPVSFLEKGESVISSYKEISEALIIGFKYLGIDLTYPDYRKVSPGNGYCMAISTGSDLNYQSKKLIGSAQFRKQNYILQHGSILLDIDKKLLSGIFDSNNPDSGLTTINRINSEIPDSNILSGAILKGFEEKFSCKFMIESLIGIN